MTPAASTAGHRVPPDEESLDPSTEPNGFANGTPDGSPPSPSSLTPKAPRALAPDLLRGLLMAFMALDHNQVGLNGWPHGTSFNTPEADSAIVTGWNWWMAYAVRTLSHLCAPGFTFLMGMGVAYFGRSRSRLGWSAARMARHFVVRGIVLTLVSVGMGFILTQGQVWFLNVVLVALAVDYVLVGLLWLLIARTEPALAAVLDGLVKHEGERTPLLFHTGHGTAPRKPSPSAERISWHAHNLALLVLAFITIWWNHWLSPTGGSCASTAHVDIPATGSTASNFWHFWFFEIMSPRVVSPFPPLAWLSFAIMGLLYARVVLTRPRAVSEQVSGHAAAAVVFASLFVLTRLLRVGNLSDGCLQTPDQAGSAEGSNPYLASAASFFYIVKYPPDFAFFSFTLAGTFTLLAAFTAIPQKTAERYGFVLLAFGQSALFFYVTHMVVLFSGVGLLLHFFGHDTGLPPPMDGRPPIGVDNLWLWWANWAAVMVIMYPLCRWYGAFKKTRSADSVWRFF
ncbi:hypothetical protein CPLU01_13193 [Colletotrichum plurivorum]|uniref:Heparan-alpha-glucosaminide N-acetyltransferase catalytic domain-containing protein n=1 Tax=Colletotrichum plurivorum TaxID=2175906 RepID=A0A8H6JUA7_9PEZI|nr:hypothetical protein CPLU01_13193 [Colletotrichum plurivorum]